MQSAAAPEKTLEAELDSKLKVGRRSGPLCSMSHRSHSHFKPPVGQRCTRGSSRSGCRRFEVSELLSRASWTAVQGRAPDSSAVQAYSRGCSSHHSRVRAAEHSSGRADPLLPLRSAPKKRTTPPKLLDLPNSILAIIASHLDQATLLRVAATCRPLRPIARRITVFAVDGTDNRTGHLLSLLEANPHLGPEVRYVGFEPIDRAQPADFARKSAWHLFKSVAALCPNIEDLAIHHLPAVDDAATQGTLFMALSKLVKLRRLELGTLDSSSYPADKPGRPSWNPPLPVDMLLWTITPLVELRSLTAVVGPSKATSLLARQMALPPAPALEEVQLVFKGEVQDVDLITLGIRVFPHAIRLTLTIDDNPGLSGEGLTEALKSLSHALQHFILTETGKERRGTYLDDSFAASRCPSLLTLAINATAISPSAVAQLPSSLVALILDISTAPQGRDSGATSTVSTTLLDLLTNNEAFLPNLGSLILLGVQQEKELWTRMAFKMACAKRRIEPMIAPLA